MNLADIAAWAEAHPEFTALVLVPLLTAIFNLAFKPKTPEQYAKIAAFSPRLAAFLQLMGAIFPDPAKASKILVDKILKGPPKPPSGPSALVPVLLFFAAVTAASACGEARAPREQARAVVLTIAEGVRQGDLACASVAKARQDVSLAEGCAAIVLEAREALIAAEDGVDAWDEVAIGKLPCAAKSATSALSRLIETVKRAGGKTPPAVDDALRLAPMLAGGCRG